MFGRKTMLGLGTLLAVSIEVCGCNLTHSGGFLKTRQLHAYLDHEEDCSSCRGHDYPANLPSRRPLNQAETAIPASFPPGGTHLTQAPPYGSNLAFYDPRELSPESQPMALSGPAAAKPLPTPIPESVFFVYKSVQGDDGMPHLVPTATAFVLSVPDSSHKRIVRFLVTARHVVDPEWAHCAEPNPTSIQIRLNRWSGGFGYETLPLETDNLRHFFTPSDTSLDLAVILLDPGLIPRLDSYKFISIPFRLIPTASELSMVQVDQQIVTAALPSRSIDSGSSFAVSRSGVLADMPSETVNIQCGPAYNPKPIHAWFIHAAVPQGLSGAPVYTAVGRGEELRRRVLLGVQSVAWPDKGLAGITTAAALGDLVESAISQTNSRVKMKMDFERGSDKPAPSGS